MLKDKVNKDYLALFAILGAYLFNAPSLDSDNLKDISWDGIVRIAKKQTVLGLLADGCFKLPQTLQPPTDIINNLRKQAYKIVMSHMLIDRVLSEATKVLNQAHIPSVLLKGQGIALEYPNPQIRQCGDIDLYVGKDRYKDAIKAFHEVWNTPEINNELNSKHYTITHDNVKIEIHRIACCMAVPWHNNELQKWIGLRLTEDRYLNTHQWIDQNVRIPNAELNAFYIFYHTWHHILTGGVGLRQLYDWAMVLYNHADEIDTEELERILKRTNLYKEWQIMGYILVNYLGLPSINFLYTILLNKREPTKYYESFSKTVTSVYMMKVDIIINQNNPLRRKR